MPNTVRPRRNPRRAVSAGRADKQADSKINLQLIRLVICLAILGGMLIARAFQPEAVQAFVFEHVQGGIRVEEAFAQIGEGLKSIFVRVPAPEDGGTSPPASPADASPLPEASQSPQPEDGDGEQAASPSPVFPQSSSTPGIGGFGAPLRLSEDFLPPSDEEDVDDTLPLPFGVEKPEKADYTIYDLPFETTMPLTGGTVTSRFGYRLHPIDGVMGFHYGLDLGAPSGTDIYAYGDGTVIAAGDSASYGKYLMVRHEGGYITLYAHCSKLIAKEGASVKMGDAIAKVGSTGKATGPHLHFEIRIESSLLNPEYYLDIEI